MSNLDSPLIRSSQYKSSTSSDYVSHALKLLNCIVSLTMLLYFWCVLGPTWKLVEFIQIVFLSLLLVLLTIPLSNRIARIAMIVIVGTVMIAWLYLQAHLWAKDLDLSIAFQIIVFGCGLLWCSGIAVACFVSERTGANGEVDLIVYLVLLNAVTAWGNPDSFNNELHLLLDVRTFILVFNCLHRLQKNEDLLRYPSFIIIVLLTIVTFMLTQCLFGKFIVGQAVTPVAILTFVIFGTIGLILLGETYFARRGTVNGNKDTIDVVCEV